MRIGIVGGGAMGTLFAYLLAARDEVAVLDVDATLTAALREGGVRIEGAAPRSVRATTDPAELYSADMLFVFVKAHETLRAVRPFAHSLNPATVIVSLQNGLGNEEAIKTALGTDVPLVLGVTSLGSDPLAAGVTQRLGRAATIIGSAGASPATTARVRDVLVGAGLETAVAYDIRPHLWGKLLANAAINPVAALLESENGIVVSDPNARHLAHAIAREGAAIAAAARVKLPFADVWDYVLGIVAETSADRNSMAIDLGRGRRTEVDAVNGAIAAAGRRYGIEAPYNDAVTSLVKARETLAANASDMAKATASS